PRHACGGGISLAIKGWERLAAQRQTNGPILQPDDDAPGLDHFVGVGRPQRNETGNASQRDELLDRLVCRTILPQADRVMREDVYNREFHQRAQADGWLHVIGKDEEARSVSTDFGQCEPVENRAHSVLADAEMQVAATVFLSFEVAGCLKREAWFGRRCEVGRAADKPRMICCDGVQYFGG